VLAAQPLGAARLREAGIESAADLVSLDDLAGVPFALKSDLREAYPFGLLAVPREQLVRVHASSGTGGRPTVVGYTAGDLETWTELMARCMTIAGVKPGMLIHNANGYGLFTGGLGFHQGGERLGCTVVPISGGQTARQAMLLRDFGAQVLVASPSYALVIAQALADEGIDAGELPLELGLFGGEPWSEGMRAQLDRSLGIRAINFYGLSEMCGPGVAVECVQARDGLHVMEDHFLVEVVEFVFTTLTKEALPLIRYRTGDIGRVVEGECECGLVGARLTAMRGRADDMLIIRGVNIYPSAVEHVLLALEGTSPNYQLIVEQRGPLAELTLELEPAPGSGGFDPDALAHALKERTGLRITVSAVQIGSIPRSAGKATRVIDRRA
jgi:phenylacetate-CoA ligase